MLPQKSHKNSDDGVGTEQNRTEQNRTNTLFRHTLQQNATICEHIDRWNTNGIRTNGYWYRSSQTTMVMENVVYGFRSRSRIFWKVITE